MRAGRCQCSVAAIGELAECERETMKLPLLVMLGIFASTAAAQAEEELEGRSGLIFRCKQNPGKPESLGACLADGAVAELPRETRAQLYVEWVYPTPFNFKNPMNPDELPVAYERMWGAWQRSAVA